MNETVNTSSMQRAGCMNTKESIVNSLIRTNNNVACTIDTHDKEVAVRQILGMTDCNMKNVRITPELADIILSNFNTNNRKMDERHVERLANSLREGKWVNSNDNITFDNEWVLSNGQHRLRAIYVSGISVDIGVTFGVNQHFNMDRGKQRSIVDNIGLSKLVLNEDLRTNKKVIELINIGLRDIDRKREIQPEYIAATINKYEIPLADFIDAGLMKGANGLSQSAITAALFSAYVNDVSLDTLKHIRIILNDGVALSEHDRPIIGLRDKLMGLHGGGYSINTERAKYVQYCVYAVVEGRTSKISKSDNWYYKFDI